VRNPPSSMLRTSENAVKKLSEKGPSKTSKADSDITGRAKWAENRPSGWFVRPRHGRFQGFSDSFKANFGELAFHALR